MIQLACVCCERINLTKSRRAYILKNYSKTKRFPLPQKVEDRNALGNDVTATHSSSHSRSAGLPMADDDGPPLVKIGRDLNAMAKTLGPIVATLDLFYHRGEIVFYDHLGNLQVMTGLKFRTWINHQGVITYLKLDEATGAPIPCSLSGGDASAVLECESFRRCVKPLAMSPYNEGGGL